MFNSLGWPEIGVLLLVTLLVVGPERLPGLAADAGKQLRQVRTWLRGMTSELKTELGPELGDLDLASLHPRTFVRQLWEDDEDDEQPGPQQLVGPSQPRGRFPLADGETAPWDPDTT